MNITKAVRIAKLIDGTGPKAIASELLQAYEKGVTAGVQHAARMALQASIPAIDSVKDQQYWLRDSDFGGNETEVKEARKDDTIGPILTASEWAAANPAGWQGVALSPDDYKRLFPNQTWGGTEETPE